MFIVIVSLLEIVAYDIPNEFRPRIIGFMDFVYRQVL
jgi:hypothetical protein